MAADANDLVTLAIAKLYTGSAAADDGYLQRIVTGASKAANKFCGRLLAARNLTEIYDGDGDIELITKNYPINSITSIHIDSTRAFAVGSLVPATYYIIDDDKRCIHGILTLWTRGVQTIQVVYNGGEVAPIDADLELAALMIIDFWYKSFKDHRFGVSSVSVGDKSISYEKGIPKQAQTLLKNFRDGVTY